jgi:type I restriction enzyme R subunit
MTENELEIQALKWFAEAGWETANGQDIASDGINPLREDYRSVLLEPHLKEALKSINADIPDAALDEVIHQLKTLDHPVAVYRNREFQRLLIDGVKVEVERDGEKESETVRLIDFTNSSNNRFLAVNQFTVQGTKRPRRPDVIAFINGLPLAVIELKNPDDEETDIWDAFHQIETYKQEIPDLFTFNEANIISDGYTARVGSLTANTEWYMPWRTLEQEGDRPLLEFELETVIRGFFDCELLLDYLQHFILFEQ